MPNKLTDVEVKKALKEYIEFADFEYIEYTSIRFDVLKNALDLINRLKDENDGLRSLLIRFIDEAGKLTNVADVVNMSLIPLMTEKTKKFKAEFKAEAYKEFAERLLKKELKSKYFSHIAYQALKFDTNNLLNELVGDDNSHNIDKQN